MNVVFLAVLCAVAWLGSLLSETGAPILTGYDER